MTLGEVFVLVLEVSTILAYCRPSLIVTSSIDGIKFTNKNMRRDFGCGDIIDGIGFFSTTNLFEFKNSNLNNTASSSGYSKLTVASC